MSQPASIGENPGHGGRTQILFGNEPRAYREVLANAVRHLRPEVEVLEVEADSLESALASFLPDMVVADRATEAVLGVSVWVELYPDYGPVSVISVAGERREVRDIQLEELLDLVDQADRLAQQG